ncbi:hypothetical protein PPERSA_02579 [Pseudocohnilembus persalinus]|uniref:Uncharacterized protein n=1 Tax=Pseudocohnilembus persalinus TaxID=266149 RepID=A0A0V0R5E4_PSEPJ|nr:hypothetical protein PPERSA_02579 [Pseudocohnilembus persalinus]|eukprot:KRX09707.1 hypothetical protein PPERSA_02579 [Pseudocohnilembus persalinus]
MEKKQVQQELNILLRPCILNREEAEQLVFIIEITNEILNEENKKQIEQIQNFLQKNGLELLFAENNNEYNQILKIQRFGIIIFAKKHCQQDYDQTFANENLGSL